VAKLQDELIRELKELHNDRGEPMQNIFYRPQEVYSGPYLKESPDLYIYFDNLRWGANNDVGNPGIYSQKTTKGSDDAGHAPNGLFLLHHPSIKSQQKDIKITDVLPTILKVMKIDAPKDLPGKPLV